MADTQIANRKKVGVPSTYTLPGSAEFILKAVNADFDGSGAAGDYLPCVTIVSDSGDVIVRAVDQNVKVAGGGDAEVSWFRGVKRQSAATAEPRCVLLGSGNGTTTLTITLTKAVPRNGVLQVVYCQATIGDDLDTASQPTNVVDSNAVAGWSWDTFPQPRIGFTRESVVGSGPVTTSQVGSAVRACTAADLGVGSTITLTFSSASPALFHTCGLVICQRAYLVTRKQFGFQDWSNGDQHPSSGASLTRLSWDDDFGAGAVTTDEDAVMITAMGAYPAVAGFTPFVGSKIGEIASGSVSVAAACAEIPDSTFPDPGGTWPSPAIQLMGNYQMVEPRTFS